MHKVQNEEKDVCDGREAQTNLKFDGQCVKNVHEFIQNLPA